MIPTTTLFTKTRNRRRHFMQRRSNPDFMHGDFKMFSRVWRSIESLFLTSGLRKNYTIEVGIRSVPQYQISPNFLFSGLFRGGRTRKIGHYAKIRYGRGKDMQADELMKSSRTAGFCTNFCKCSGGGPPTFPLFNTTPICSRKVKHR